MQWNNTDVNNYATSTIHKYLNETYYNTLPREDREKLRTKAVQEEFHGNSQSGDAFIGKLLYGWGTLNANIWLPSLSELVGTTGDSADWSGCYYSAMQGMNISSYWYVDAKGGTQFAYFQQFNASGGGEAIWDACNQQVTWLRSPDYAQNQHVTAVLEGGNPSTYILPTASYAVHPAVLYNPERPVKQTGIVVFV